MTRVARGLDPAERRALLRRHHPDLGGDPEEFVRVMAAIDALGAASAPTAPSPSREGTAREAQHSAATGGPLGTTPRRRRRRRRARRLLLRVRAGLPRRLPGARRYGQL